MGNGTKVALVALLVLMVVVIARFVRKESGDDEVPPPAQGAQLVRAGDAGNPATSPDARLRAANPANRSQGTMTQAPGANQGRDGNKSARSAQGRGAPGTTPASHVATSTPSSSRSLSPDARVSSNIPYPPPRSVAAPPLDADPSAIQWVGPKIPVETVAPSSTSPGGADRSGGRGTQVSSVGQNLTPLPALGGRQDDAPGVAPGRGADPGQGAPSLATARQGQGGPTSSIFMGADGLPRFGPDGMRVPPPAVPSVTDPSRDPNVPDRGTASQGAELNAARFPRKHTIVQNDTYWMLAKTYYGKGTLWKHIENANPGIKLHPGKVVTIPAPPPEAKPASERAPLANATPPESSSVPERRESPATSSTPQPRRHLIQKGDTLWSLAKRFYGDPKKLDLIVQANSELGDADGILVAGRTLLIPPAP